MGICRLGVVVLFDLACLWDLLHQNSVAGTLFIFFFWTFCHSMKTKNKKHNSFLSHNTINKTCPAACEWSYWLIQSNAKQNIFLWNRIKAFQSTYCPDLKLIISKLFFKCIEAQNWLWVDLQLTNKHTHACRHTLVHNTVVNMWEADWNFCTHFSMEIWVHFFMELLVAVLCLEEKNSSVFLFFFAQTFSVCYGHLTTNLLFSLETFPHWFQPKSPFILLVWSLQLQVHLLLVGPELSGLSCEAGGGWDETKRILQCHLFSQGMHSEPGATAGKC